MGTHVHSFQPIHIYTLIRYSIYLSDPIHGVLHTGQRLSCIENR